MTRPDERHPVVGAPFLHEWCGHLHDPVRDQPCPCQPVTEVLLRTLRKRHEDAVARAKRSGWADQAWRANTTVLRAGRAA